MTGPAGPAGGRSVFPASLAQERIWLADQGAALPAPRSAVTAERPRVGPRTDLERLIARVWRDVLGIAATRPMGIDENFVDLGGHSLHAALVVAAIRRKTPDLRRTSVFDLFAHPTVRELAAFTAAAPAGAPARCCTS